MLIEEEKMQATLSKRELIQAAINKERASFALYSCAAVQAGSEKVKKVFNRIAPDEKRDSIKEEDIDLWRG